MVRGRAEHRQLAEVCYMLAFLGLPLPPKEGGLEEGGWWHGPWGKLGGEGVGGEEEEEELNSLCLVWWAMVVCGRVDGRVGGLLMRALWMGRKYGGGKGVGGVGGLSVAARRQALQATVALRVLGRDKGGVEGWEEKEGPWEDMRQLELMLEVDCPLPPHPPPTTSRLQDAVGRFLLDGMGCSPFSEEEVVGGLGNRWQFGGEKEVVLARLGYSLDFVLFPLPREEEEEEMEVEGMSEYLREHWRERRRKGRGLVVEVDGPSHFLQGGGGGVERWVGPSRLKHRVLTALCEQEGEEWWDGIIHISSYEWQAAKGEEERRRLVVGKVEALGLDPRRYFAKVE